MRFVRIFWKNFKKGLTNLCFHDRIFWLNQLEETNLRV